MDRNASLASSFISSFDSSENELKDPANNCKKLQFTTSASPVKALNQPSPTATHSLSITHSMNSEEKEEKKERVNCEETKGRSSAKNNLYEHFADCISTIDAEQSSAKENSEEEEEDEEEEEEEEYMTRSNTSTSQLIAGIGNNRSLPSSSPSSSSPSSYASSSPTLTPHHPLSNHPFHSSSTAAASISSSSMVTASAPSASTKSHSPLSHKLLAISTSHIFSTSSKTSPQKEHQQHSDANNWDNMAPIVDSSKSISSNQQSIPSLSSCPIKLHRQTVQQYQQLEKEEQQQQQHRHKHKHHQHLQDQQQSGSKHSDNRNNSKSNNQFQDNTLTSSFSSISLSVSTTSSSSSSQNAQALMLKSDQAPKQHGQGSTALKRHVGYNSNRLYTRLEVSQHNTAESCWLIVRDTVYDVTDFLIYHPAGSNSILRHAGQDATRDFDFHDSEAQLLWKNFIIGKLVSNERPSACSKCM